ncbi:hypothetical protein CXG81DRAFT_27460 [Caulochytrium protostelioides]|uniref:Uncharacterized protein n=1 Tax=Caulochytrium protostelioides TaxID=1555241 RepID=A0A4P9X425_9FUNG|nr:hypothetical protein CXG81DRAFT_27460 [Caulochytrium protostelioides]|eukprot:RKO99805.1 hypothetical protein CXG81DRAFT_27460 [Caulochytrium protostelioides]
MGREAGYTDGFLLGVDKGFAIHRDLQRQAAYAAMCRLWLATPAGAARFAPGPAPAPSFSAAVAPAASARQRRLLRSLDHVEALLSAAASPRDGPQASLTDATRRLADKCKVLQSLLRAPTSSSGSSGVESRRAAAGSSPLTPTAAATPASSAPPSPPGEHLTDEMLAF